MIRADIATHRHLVAAITTLVVGFAALTSLAGPATASSDVETTTQAAAKGAATTGLATCAATNATVKAGSKGGCVDALQSFLRYTINYRGYGPVCPSSDGSLGSLIRYTGTMDKQTQAYLRCYQEYVGLRAKKGQKGYTVSLNIDGTADRRDFLVMTQNTCAGDDSFLSQTTSGSFGSRWFCTA